MKETEGCPTTFREMFKANEGDNFLQRGLKTYIRPKGDPETAIRVFEALRVDQVQKAPKLVIRFFLRDLGRFQGTYTIKDSSLPSLVDYGSEQTAINELMHLGAIASCVIPGIVESASGSFDNLPYIGTAIFINTYLILTQRYSRARIEKIVNKRLSRGDKIGHYTYKNRLNLRLPE